MAGVEGRRRRARAFAVGNPTFDGWRRRAPVSTVDVMTDKVAMIIRSTTQPGRRDEVFALYRELLAPRAEANDGQELVVWCDDQHDPDTFYLFEVYADAAAMGANAQAPWFADYLAKASPLLAGEPTVGMASPRWSTGL